MQRIVGHLETLRRYGQRLGPYLMLEILLPGGSLFALALFLYQRRKHGTGRAVPRPVQAVMRAWASTLLRPAGSRAELDCRRPGVTDEIPVPRLPR